MLKGFKDFILRGNVVDLAVGIMIGAAFNSVISSFVKDLMTPLIAAIFRQPNFGNLTFTVNGSQFLYGDFLNNLLSFLITAISVYFFVVIPINKLNGLMRKNPPAEVTVKQCPECLSSIPVKARRCAYCASAQSDAR